MLKVERPKHLAPQVIYLDEVGDHGRTGALRPSCRPFVLQHFSQTFQNGVCINRAKATRKQLRTFHAVYECNQNSHGLHTVDYLD